MSESLSTLRSSVMQLITPRYVSSTPDSVGVGSIVDSGLKHFKDSYFLNYFVLDSNGITFTVTDFAQSSGTLSLLPTDVTPGTGSYEISLLIPANLTRAINRAASRNYPVLSRSYGTEAYVTGSPIVDPGFEDWLTSSTLVAWTVSGSTLSRSTSNPLFGGANAHLTGAGALITTSRFRQGFLDLRGHDVTLYTWVKTAAASNGRLNLTYVTAAGVTTNNRSGFHTGVSGWELLDTGAISIPSDATSVYLQFENVAGSVVEFDNCWIEGGPRVSRHIVPTALHDGPTRVQIAAIGDREDINSLSFQDWPFTLRVVREYNPGNSSYALEWGMKKHPPAGYRIRMEGSAKLNTLSADTDVVSLDGTDVDLLVALATLEALDTVGAQTVATSHTNLDEIKNDQRRAVARLMKQTDHPEAVGSLNWGL